MCENVLNADFIDNFPFTLALLTDILMLHNLLTSDKL